MEQVEVLIPAYERPAALAETLTGLCFQEDPDFSVIIADQSETPVYEDDAVRAAVRLLEKKGHQVQTLRNLPRRGIAQQRQFLLDHATAPYCLYIDADVLLEPFVVGMMQKALEEEPAGFVGQGLIGLSYTDDHRPDEEAIELWDGPVQPETVTPDSPAWQRYRLHNAANVLHVQEALGATPYNTKKYKVAWIGGCVMYDTGKLRSVGGFGFWNDVPKDHAGEDVYVQQKVMARYGGFGLLPSGAYHQEAPTTIPNRKFDIPKELDL